MSRKFTQNEALLIKKIINQALQEQSIADKWKAWREKRKEKKAKASTEHGTEIRGNIKDPPGKEAPESIGRGDWSERPGEEWRTGRHRKDTEMWSRGGVDRTIQPSGKGYHHKKFGGSDIMRALKQQHADDTVGRNRPPKDPRDAGGGGNGGDGNGGGGDSGAGNGGNGGDGGDGNGGDSGTGGDSSKFAVPVFKKFSGKEQEAGAPQRSLSSQLMKLFPDIPKSAITQMLKDVASQLKHNGINIQENAKLIAKVLLERLSYYNQKMIIEGRKSQGNVTSAEVGAGEAGSILQQLDQLLDSLSDAEQVEAFRTSVQAGELPEGAQGTPLNKGGSKKVRTYYGEGGEGFKKIQDKLSSLSKPSPCDVFKKELKDRDLDSAEGRAGAAKNDQAYLGAYMLYKKINKALPKLAAVPECESWAKEQIKFFKIGGLTNPDRAVKASRSARGVKEPKEKEYAPKKITKLAGKVNLRQSVGPNLKKAGIELNSPEGTKLHNRLQKVIRRFLVKNLMRVSGQSEEEVRNMIIAQPATLDKRKAQVAQAMKESIESIKNILKAEGYVITEADVAHAIDRRVQGLISKVFGKTRVKSGGGFKEKGSTFKRAMSHLRKTNPDLYKDTIKDLTDAGAIDKKDIPKKKEQDKEQDGKKEQAIKETINKRLIYEVLAKEKELITMTLDALKKRGVVV